MEKLLPIEIMRRAARGVNYIGHPLRLRILEYLDVNGESSVSDITKALNVEQVILSQHLKKMRDADLVKTNRRGNFIYYSVYKEYPASIFNCVRKLFGVMSENLEFIKDGYKAILPTDFTIMVAGRIKSFANFDKMRVLEYLLIHEHSSVNEIADGIEMQPVKVSQILKKLKDEEFVSFERNGRNIFYDITKGVHKTTIKCIRKRYTNLKNKF